MDHLRGIVKQRVDALTERDAKVAQALESLSRQGLSADAPRLTEDEQGAIAASVAQIGDMRATEAALRGWIYSSTWCSCAGALVALQQDRGSYPNDFFHRNS